MHCPREDKVAEGDSGIGLVREIYAEDAMVLGFKEVLFYIKKAAVELNSFVSQQIFPTCSRFWFRSTILHHVCPPIGESQAGFVLALIHGFKVHQRILTSILPASLFYQPYCANCLGGSEVCTFNWSGNGYTAIDTASPEKRLKLTAILKISRRQNRHKSIIKEAPKADSNTGDFKASE